jgi:ABC-type multidrug transport system ATPase subunit
LSTHWLLRESAVWHDRNTAEVREAQRHADYAYRLAVDPPAAKELRLFGLADWVLARFVERRTLLFERIYHATRLRERPLAWSLLLVTSASLAVFAALALGSPRRPAADRPDRGLRPQLAVGVSAIAFGGMSWALDGGSGAGRRRAPPLGRRWRRQGRALTPAVGISLARGLPRARGALSAAPLRVSRSVSPPCSTGLDLVIPEGSLSLAIVGQNGAGKTTLAKLLCRLYDPTEGAIEVDGVDLREHRYRGVARARHGRLPGLHALRALAARQRRPGRRARRDVLAALEDAAASGLAGLDTPLARGYPGGTDLSGGQWQRVALARALCAVRQGAGLVLLDEPTRSSTSAARRRSSTASSPPRGKVTTILISHRFSTVRHADRIAVIEHGRVLELGSHDELMARAAATARCSSCRRSASRPTPTRKEPRTSRSPDTLPPALPSMWRLLKLGIATSRG